MKKLIFFTIFALSFCIFNTASAQLNSISQSALEVEMVPANPGANQSVTVSLASYSTNINTANIIWKVNGTTKLSGTGEKIFNFNTGNLNTATVVSITVETVSGEVIEKELYIKPVSVDIIWESEGYVPPFYKGKALFSHQNKITFVALPHITNNSGQEISAKNLVYTWKKNGKVVDYASGYGKSSFSFISTVISRPFSIEVEVSSGDSNDVAYSEIYMNPTEPTIIFYEKNPLNGIQFQKAIDSGYSLGNLDELIVLGLPYFFGTTDPNSDELSYKWAINGTSISNNADKQIQVLRRPEGISGSSKISLSIENANKILQYKSNNFNLVFGDNGN